LTVLTSYGFYLRLLLRAAAIFSNVAIPISSQV